MIDRRIKFRHIQCFVEISRFGSFKQAAEQLALSQPAISKTLKELETLLGHQLLTRDRGGVALTPDGTRFLRHAEEALAALQQGITGLDQASSGTQPILSVGVLPSVAARLVPVVVETLRQDMPDALLRIIDGPLLVLLDRLKLGMLDLVVGRMGPHEQMRGLQFAPLYRERVGFVVRPGHPLLKQPSLAGILAYPVIYPNEGAAIRPIADRFFAEHGMADVPRQIETVSDAFGRVHVQRSDAVWIISEGVVAPEIARGELVTLPIDTNTTLGPIGVTTREAWEYTSHARQFLRILHEAVDRAPDIG